jgi:hypothetical protein
MSQILSFLTGLIALALLIMKGSSDNKHEREALKKEVDNAIESSDLDRLNLLIHRINRM